VTVFVKEVDRISGDEPALAPGDTGREQRHASSHDRLHGAMIEQEAPTGRGLMLEPEQPARGARPYRVENRAGVSSVQHLAHSRGRGHDCRDARGDRDRGRLDLGDHSAAPDA